jgi:hypothetical protein
MEWPLPTEARFPEVISSGFFARLSQHRSGYPFGSDAAMRTIPQVGRVVHSPIGRYFTSPDPNQRTGAAAARREAPLQMVSDVSAPFWRATRSAGKGQPSKRARVRTLIVVRRNAAAARMTDSPCATKAFRRSSSASVQGRFLGSMIILRDSDRRWQKAETAYVPGSIRSSVNRT